jgi:hypothetical protein
MGKVTNDISMSLDGFITEPNEDDPGRLHDWMSDVDGPDWRTERRSDPYGLVRREGREEEE